MQAPHSFTDLLALASDSARQLDDDGVLSLAMPLAGGDPMALLQELKTTDGFRFLWDGAPGLCLAASGRCNSLELSGPRRFELAQRFASASLSRLVTAPECPPLARPRVLLAFGFFDAPLDASTTAIPGVQAVLPRWQLSRQGQHCWLRLQSPLGGGITARSLAEELWEQAQTLLAARHHTPEVRPVQLCHSSLWQHGYRSAVDHSLVIRAELIPKVRTSPAVGLQLATSPNMVADVRDAFIHGWWLSLWVAAGIFGVGALVMFVVAVHQNVTGRTRSTTAATGDGFDLDASPFDYAASSFEMPRYESATVTPITPTAFPEMPAPVVGSNASARSADDDLERLLGGIGESLDAVRRIVAERDAEIAELRGAADRVDRARTDAANIIERAASELIGLARSLRDDPSSSR